MRFDTPEKEPSNGKNFLKIGDGKSVVGVFRGDIHTYYQVFENGRYRVVPSTDANGKFAFKINFICKDNGSLVAKIFQGNYYDYQALRELHDEYDLEKVYTQISQTGERQTKRISFLPKIKQKPDEKQLATILLHDLGPKDGNETTLSFEDDEIPF
jgi:hypothetical protein